MECKILFLLAGLTLIAALIWIWFWRVRQQTYGEAIYLLPAGSIVGAVKPRTVPYSMNLHQVSLKLAEQLFHESIELFVRL